MLAMPYTAHAASSGLLENMIITYVEMRNNGMFHNTIPSFE
jgi:hypothetical protein